MAGALAALLVQSGTGRATDQHETAVPQPDQVIDEVAHALRGVGDDGGEPVDAAVDAHHPQTLDLPEALGSPRGDQDQTINVSGQLGHEIDLLTPGILGRGDQHMPAGGGEMALRAADHGREVGVAERGDENADGSRASRR